MKTNEQSRQGPRDNERIVKVLSIIVAAAGALTIAGWAFNITVLKSVLPGWAPMKLSSAITFIFSGITMYAIADTRHRHSGFAQVALPLTVLPILLLMGTFLASFVLNLRLGIEELFISEGERFSFTVVPGRPSLATAIAFILVAASGTIQLFEPRRIKLLFLVLGGILSSIGGSAIIGYIMNAPGFYYYRASVTSAMSLFSGILFILLGVSLILMGTER